MQGLDIQFRTFKICSQRCYSISSSAAPLVARLKQEYSRILRCDAHVHPIAFAARGLSSPDIGRGITCIGIQLWDLVEFGAHGHRIVRWVEQGDHCPLSRRSAPVHGWVGAVERPVWVDAPFVWFRRCAIDWILVERQEVSERLKSADDSNEAILTHLF
jgi:hypothetical protein